MDFAIAASHTLAGYGAKQADDVVQAADARRGHDAANTTGASRAGDATNTCGDAATTNNADDTDTATNSLVATSTRRA